MVETFEVAGFSVATVPAIAAIVYFVIEFLKKIFSEKELFFKLIPLIACVLGVGVAIIAFFIEPNVVPAKEWYYAAILGAASGLSSVGVNQIGKQIKKGGENDAT